jgi:hypothetical protein
MYKAPMRDFEIFLNNLDSSINCLYILRSEFVICKDPAIILPKITVNKLTIPF